MDRGERLEGGKDATFSVNQGAIAVEGEGFKLIPVEHFLILSIG